MGVHIRRDEVLRFISATGPRLPRRQIHATEAHDAPHNPDPITPRITPRSKRWAPVSGSANAEMDYKWATRDPKAAYAFVCMCRPPFRLQNDDPEPEWDGREFDDDESNDGGEDDENEDENENDDDENGGSAAAAFFKADSKPKPTTTIKRETSAKKSTPIATTASATPFDDGEPDFAGWLAAQAEKKKGGSLGGKALPKGLAAGPRKIRWRMRSSTGSRPLPQRVCS